MTIISLFFFVGEKNPFIFTRKLFFFSFTGHNSNKPTAKWNPVTAKGLDERGFL